MAKKEFTQNEAVSFMHRERADSLKNIADHIEKWKLPWDKTVKLLREIISDAELAAIDVEMRDSKGFRVERTIASGEWTDTLKKIK